jgi:hypothetical protein
MDHLDYSSANYYAHLLCLCIYIVQIDRYYESFFASLLMSVQTIGVLHRFVGSQQYYKTYSKKLEFLDMSNFNFGILFSFKCAFSFDSWPMFSLKITMPFVVCFHVWNRKVCGFLECEKNG